MLRAFVFDSMVPSFLCRSQEKNKKECGVSPVTTMSQYRAKHENLAKVFMLLVPTTPKI